MTFRHISRDQHKALLDARCRVIPAGLYEPEHNPQALFVIIKDRGLYRIYPPKDTGTSNRLGVNDWMDLLT